MPEIVREDGVTHHAADFVSANGNSLENGGARSYLPFEDFGTIEGTDPTNATAGNIHGTVTLTGSPTVINSGFTQPAKPRSVYINDIDNVGSGIFIVHGKDALGATISSTVDISSTHQTDQCFAEIDSINCPASNGNHFNFGTGMLVGFDFVDANPINGIPAVNNSVQITFSGLQAGWGMDAANDATHVSKNYVPLGSPLSGDFEFKFYYITK